MGVEGVALGLEEEAALRDGGVKLGEASKVSVDERLVDEAPQALGRLQVGGVARQGNEPEPVGNREPWLGVPAGALEHQHDKALPPGPDLAGKEGQQSLKEGLQHAVRQRPEHLAGGRLHDGRHNRAIRSDEG